jgi:hypothetical protein
MGPCQAREDSALRAAKDALQSLLLHLPPRIKKVMNA